MWAKKYGQICMYGENLCIWRWILVNGNLKAVGETFCIVKSLGSNNVCICGSLGTQAYLYVQQQVCQHISPIMHWTWSALHHIYHVKTYFMCKHNFYMYDIYIPTSISLPRTTNIYVNDFHPHCTEDPALKDSQSTISSPAMWYISIWSSHTHIHFSYTNRSCQDFNN